MISQTQKWFDALTWETVVELNQKLCAAARVVHEVVPERHDQVRKLWETVAAQSIDLQEALDALRQCVRQAPFRYNNMNTFSGVARKLVDGFARKLPPVEARILSTTVSHYVEGKVRKAELRQVIHQFAKQLQAMPEPVAAPPAAPPVRIQPQTT